ncbi:tetraacyldisaccharide 4'-kinase [Leptospira perolatii]|uniref:Tetraacyldisaccharide 4'-kinase n=1 Tax=Leptospira perolatii TaxID=2023191 RepID=A0A2M9ZT79_9LEPT|nr:tetraacyldisaccharide 4'-kinase [Leptospira perolatii]PJZ75214.1 tetraacyldisaccharide 4'-kinase [Leptospira perolatii]
MRKIFYYLFFPILYILSFVYRLLFLLDRLRKKKSTLSNAIVISVGNFSVGGTGKTPFTLELANLLKIFFSDTPILILSRGYGSKTANSTRVTTQSLPEEVGDEPLLLKRNLPFAEIYIGRDRQSSYLKYRKEILSDDSKAVFVLLDDGFQTHKIHRDLDIVLLDCTRIKKDNFLLPAGRLRESYNSSARADMIIASKYSQQYDGDLISWIKKYRPNQVLKFSMTPVDLKCVWSESKSVALDTIKNKKVLAFTGLGNPNPFFEDIASLHPKELTRKPYLDHYSYRAKDLEELRKNIGEIDYLVCTEKDAVKLQTLAAPKFPEKFLFLKISPSLENKEILIEQIRGQLVNR